MLKSAAKIAANAAELPSPTGSAGNQSPGSPNDASGQAAPRPRKKLSFKEPEIFNYLRMRKPSFRSKPAVATPSPRTTVSFVENPLEEENGELDELEVKITKGELVPFFTETNNLVRQKSERPLSPFA